MKIRLEPIYTECFTHPNAHITGIGDPDATEHRVYSANVFVDDQPYGTASDCDLGRWIITDNVTRPWDSNEMGPLDGCYPADCLDALAYAIAECVDGVNHDDVEVLS